MFTLTKIEWLVLAVALALCPGVSWGAEPSDSLFERLDRNKDGYLTQDELAADEAKSRNWIAVDRDGDGRISRSEFGLVAVPPSKMEEAPSPNAAAGGSKQPKPE
jgi:Ca2+-binding EF-hand superfamily protein